MELLTATQTNTTPKESVEVASMNVIDHALALFGSAEQTVRWLKTPNQALAGVRPWDYLDSPAHVERVFVVLNRLEHGVFS